MWMKLADTVADVLRDTRDKTAELVSIPWVGGGGEGKMKLGNFSLMGFSLSGAELSLNSANSGNLKNH